MLNIIVVGMGPIGISAARAVEDDPGMKLVGMVDVDPGKIGRTLDEIAGKGKGPGPVCVERIADAAKAGGQVAIVSRPDAARMHAAQAARLQQLRGDELAAVSSCKVDR